MKEGSRKHPADFPCREADPLYTCRFNFIVCFKPEISPDWSKKKTTMEKEHATHSSLQPNHFFISMQHYLSVAVTSQVICMAVGIGEAWLMWPGRAEVVCVIGCLFVLMGKKNGVWCLYLCDYDLQPTKCTIGMAMPRNTALLATKYTRYSLFLKYETFKHELLCNSRSLFL